MSLKNFWFTSPEAFTELDSESRVYYLHPWLRQRISSFAPQRILDFGCGDGTLFRTYGSSYHELWLCDHSPKMLDLARRTLSDRSNTSFLIDRRELPTDYFDLIVCSLVLMTIDDQAELNDVVRTMAASTSESGRCLVALTHPCFRQYPFSTFETDFVRRSFDYMKVGEPFEVTLYDVSRCDKVSFTDFHWPLAVTLNMFLSAGFNLRAMHELPDKAMWPELENTRFPAYMVLEFSRR